MKQYLVKNKQYDPGIGLSSGDESELLVNARSAAEAKHKINKIKNRIVTSVELVDE